MPRCARVVLPNVPLHLIQRGNNRQVCFVADEDFRVYLDLLHECAGKTGCRIHTWVLMTNHVHLLVSAEVSVMLGRRVTPWQAGRPGGMLECALFRMR